MLHSVRINKVVRLLFSKFIDREWIEKSVRDLAQLFHLSKEYLLPFAVAYFRKIRPFAKS